MSHENGFVYVMTNEAMPGIVKIGCSKHDPRERAKQLQSTGVPCPFIVAFAVLVEDHQQVEKDFFDVYESRRVDSRREFFRMDVERAVEALFNECGIYELNAVHADFYIDGAALAYYASLTDSIGPQVVSMIQDITVEEWQVLKYRYQRRIEDRKNKLAERRAERQPNG